MKQLCLISALLILVQVSLFGQGNLELGLVAYYPFNGNANDESGNGNHGNVQGASLTFDQFGNPNSAYYFNGNDNLINCGHGNSLQLTNALTISAWFKSNISDVFGRYIIGKCDYYSSSYEYLICWGYGLSSCVGGENYDEVHSDFYPTTVSWYHVAVTFEYPGNLNLYLNGVKLNSTVTTGNIEPTTQDVVIGCIRPSGEPTYRYFNGIIDEVRIYNRALSESEIRQLIPVELTSFAGLVENNYVILKWTTQSETENYGFNVFRSQIKDGEYEKITNELIPGTGNSDQVHTYSYIDRNVTSGNTYYYKLADVDFSGNMKFHGPISVTVEARPTKYSLEQSFPNPFNPETAINFSIKEAGKVSLKIYNLQGQLIRSLVDEDKLDGSYSIIWNGTTDQGIRIASGTYLYTLKVNGFEETKKLVFMK